MGIKQKLDDIDKFIKDNIIFIFFPLLIISLTKFKSYLDSFYPIKYILAFLFTSLYFFFTRRYYLSSKRLFLVIKNRKGNFKFKKALLLKTFG